MIVITPRIIERYIEARYDSYLFSKQKGFYIDDSDRRVYEIVDKLEQKYYDDPELLKVKYRAMLKKIATLADNVVQKIYQELNKKGVKREIIKEMLANPLKYFGRIINDAVFYYTVGYTDIEYPWIIYGETMGFLYDGSKWDVFEGSDEPGEIDAELYRKLILGRDDNAKIKLYGMHNAEFVESWLEKGIPPDVYFATQKWIAERYWHPEGGDVLVLVEIPARYLIQTDSYEYKTIETVPVGEFTLKYL